MLSETWGASLLEDRDYIDHYDPFLNPDAGLWYATNYMEFPFVCLFTGKEKRNAILALAIL